MEQKKNKSKLMIIILIAIVIIAVVGIVVVTSNKGSIPEIPGAKEYAPGETVTTSDFDITLNDVKYGNSLCGLSQRA